MYKVVVGGYLRDFSAAIGGLRTVRVSHLLSADDTLIFCDAYMDEPLDYLRQLLIRFQQCQASRSNTGSKTIPEDEANNIENLTQVLNCSIGAQLTTHLRLPLGAFNKDQAVWNPVIERIEKRLAL